YRLSSRTALTLVITLLLSASPEILAAYNQSSSGVELRANLSNRVAAWPPLQPLVELYHKNAWLSPERFNGEPAAKDDNSPPPSSVPRIKYELHIEGMGCEGCANRLRQHLISQPGVKHVKVFFSEKRLEMWTPSGLGALSFSENNIQEMVAALDKKYSVKLVAMYSSAEVSK
ncbi:hypothetical protein BGZ65_000467, partial [Modicella reniformis]